MKTSFHHCLTAVLLLGPILGFGACANRGMEAPGTPMSDGGPSSTGGHGPGSGGAAGSGTGGHLSGSGGLASGGSGGHGGSGTGGVSTGGSGGVLGTGGLGTGGGTGGKATGGASGGTGGVSTGGTGGAGTGGAAGRGGQTGAGGTAGQGGTPGQGGAAGSGPIVISIDFVGGRPASTGAGGAVAAPAMGATETAGVKAAANWNSADGVMGTLANLLAADGSATAATVTWNSPPSGINNGEWTNMFTDAAGDTRMMNGYLDPSVSTSPATVKVNALPAALAGGYDVYVYCMGDIPQTTTRTYQYAIGGTTVTVSQTGSATATTFPGFTLAASGGSGNYIIFRKVTGATFTLTATPGTGSQTRAPINGIQIVWPSGS